MRSSIRSFAVVACIVGFGCRCDRTDDEPPPSVRAVSDPCENPVAALESRVKPETSLRASGLRLWRVYPCHRMTCFIVGSDTDGGLVGSDDLVISVLAAEKTTDPMRAANLVVRIVGEDQPNPQRVVDAQFTTPTSLTFHAAERDPTGGSPLCSRYDVDLTRKTVLRENVSTSKGKDCGERG